MLGLSFTVASGERTSILIPQVEWTQQVAKHLQLELKLSYYIARGDFESHSGIGDPIVSLSRRWQPNGSVQLSFTAGTRISLTDASATTKEGSPLPMPYQTGLGTADGIVGLGLQYKRWLSVSAGYQQPIIHYNNNGYLASIYQGAPQEFSAHFDSRKLRRSGDVLLRADAVLARKHWNLAAGPLLIYHLANDKVTLLNGEQVGLAESNGLTANLTAKAGYMRKRMRYELSAGAPFIVRKQRPDGLTRHWTISLSIGYALP
jgi:hypothetical protein